MTAMAMRRRAPPTAPPTMAAVGFEVAAGWLEVGDGDGERVEVDEGSAAVERPDGSSGQRPPLWHGLPVQHPKKWTGVVVHVQ